MARLQWGRESVAFQAPAVPPPPVLTPYSSDSLQLHLRDHLNQDSVAKNSLQITGLVHHIDSEDEETDSEPLWWEGELGL